MRKLLCMLLPAAMVLSANAWCDTQAPAAADARVTKAKRCLFPNSRKRAPDWVCNAHADGMALAAVGSAAKSSAGISFMEQMAAADARVHLARNLRRSVQNRLKADGDSAQITRIANDSLQGTRIVKSAYGPDGTLYVLVGIDEQNAKKLVDSITAEYQAQQHK